MPKDKSNLVRKVITNKLGHRQTVWVNPETKREHIKRKVDKLMSKNTYEKTLKELNTIIDQATGDKSKKALGAKLIMMTGMRIGNIKSAEGERAKGGLKTYGVSTLTKKHIKIKGDKVSIKFVGKKGVKQDVNITSKKLADQIKKYFKSSKGETFLEVSPKMLADYIRKELGVNPKDLRTLRANIVAIKESKRIRKTPKPKNKAEANKEIDKISEKVGKVLGNTKGVARRSYIDDDLLETHKRDRFKKAENLKAFFLELIDTL